MLGIIRHIQRPITARNRIHAAKAICKSRTKASKKRHTSQYCSYIDDNSGGTHEHARMQQSNLLRPPQLMQVCRSRAENKGSVKNDCNPCGIECWHTFSQYARFCRPCCHFCARVFAVRHRARRPIYRLGVPPFATSREGSWWGTKMSREKL